MPQGPSTSSLFVETDSSNSWSSHVPGGSDRDSRSRSLRKLVSSLCALYRQKTDRSCQLAGGIEANDPFRMQLRVGSIFGVAGCDSSGLTLRELTVGRILCSRRTRRAAP